MLAPHTKIYLILKIQMSTTSGIFLLSIKSLVNLFFKFTYYTTHTSNIAIRIPILSESHPPFTTCFELDHYEKKEKEWKVIEGIFGQSIKESWNI